MEFKEKDTNKYTKIIFLVSENLNSKCEKQVSLFVNHVSQSLFYKKKI